MPLYRQYVFLMLFSKTFAFPVSLTVMVCLGGMYMFIGDKDNLVTRPYLPFIYPDCCTANEVSF